MSTHCQSTAPERDAPIGSSGERLSRPLQPSEGASRFRELINIGHRGASGSAPENTTAAFDLALYSGAHFLELDVHMSRDGVPIVFHDPSLERIARDGGRQCSGPIGSMSLEELRVLDTGSWFNESYPSFADEGYVGLPITTLEEVVDRYRHCARFCIELKHPESNPGMEEAVVDLVHRFELDRQVAGKWRIQLLSMHRLALQRIHTLDDTLPLLQLFEEKTSETSIRAALEDVACYATGIGCPKESVSRRLVGAAHELGLQIVCFTVNELDEMNRLVDMHVDGICTDFPDRLDGLLRRRLAQAAARPTSAGTQ